MGFPCLGVVCDIPGICRAAGVCQYKSSAQEAQEFLQDVPEPTDEPVEDFVGKADGKGVKQVMKEPKSGVQMIDPYFIQGIGDVLTYGAQKYAANNWMRGMSWTTVFGAVLRHLLAWFQGEQYDKESGLPHLYHAACSLMFLAYYQEMTEHEQYDDRVYNR